MRNGILITLVLIFVSGFAHGEEAARPEVVKPCNVLQKDGLKIESPLIRKNRALTNIEVNGKAECAMLPLVKERENCYKVLEVAKAMVIQAYDRNSTKVVCR